jgi:PBSX family phage terminase large subunit
MFDPNPLYYKMLRLFVDNYSENNKVEIYNEGSSRSSKTFDAFHFIYTFCDHNRNKWNDIYILRNVLKDCREYTYKDFKKCMQIIGVKEPDITYMKENQEPTVTLFGNNIYFRGLNDEANQEGYPSDIVFFNEMLEIQSKSKIAGIVMRCRKMIVGDWNPKFTQHWAFDLEKRDNAFFTKTNYRQNKHLQLSVKKEIESYYPWLIEDMHLPEKERRPNVSNIKNQTADAYRAYVYGEGVRSAPEGLIFQHVNYIESWPSDVAGVYGLDFGFTTDPSALTRVGETKTDIYIELLMYQPTETSDMINEYAKARKINRNLPCEADSSDKYTGENKGTVEMVKELKQKGWRIKKVKKTKGIMFWLGKMKKKRINIIINDLVHEARKEQEGYCMKVVNGYAINQPIDKFNHMWDSARYGFMSLNENKGGMW